MKQNRANVPPEIVDEATSLLWTASPKGTLSHTPERWESERLESITCCKILDMILYIRFIKILQVHSSLQPSRLKSQTSPPLHNQWQELLGRRAEEDLPSSKIIHEPQMDKKWFTNVKRNDKKVLLQDPPVCQKKSTGIILWVQSQLLAYHLETKWGIECENNPNHTIIIDFLWPTIILLDPTHLKDRHSGISCHASAVLAWIASSLSRREKLASSKWTDRLRLTLGDISGRNRKQ